jgi:hypothetical protein
MVERISAKKNRISVSLFEPQEALKMNKKLDQISASASPLSEMLRRALRTR